MNAVVDRIVQYANRYKLTDVSTGKVLGTFDFDEVTGTVQQVGTEINKELFDSIAADLATRLVANGGDSKDLIVTFTAATSVENIASKEKHSIIFGKIAKWFTDRISKLKKFTYDSATKITSSDIDGTIPTKAALENGDITVMNAENANSASRATADKNGKDITTYVAKETDPTVPAWAKNATKPTYTKAEVGLGNVDNTADLEKPISTATQNALSGKVDKVSGKGLSTNDYTTAEKNKLAGLATDTVRYGEQTLTQAQKSQARSNIGAGTSSFDGTWNSLSGKPNIVQSTGQSTKDVMSQKAVSDALGAIKADKHSQTGLSNEDLDTLQGEDYVGWYYAGGSNTCANKPAGVDAFGLEVGRSAGGYYFQVLTSANSTSNRRFVRTYSSSWSEWVKLAITDDIPTKVSQLANDSNFATTSQVNAKYTKPSGGIPKSDLASSVQTSLGKADTALQSAPVTSVNGKTGAVSLGAGDVGALPSSTKFVSSVNGKTGAVTGLATTDEVNKKQNTLTEAQLAAANSGITEAKRTKYDGYEATINKKANSADLAQVATSGSYNDLSDKPIAIESVIDYGDTSKKIKIGYSGAGITGDAIKYIAGFTTGDGGAVAKIKDISKDAMKAWLAFAAVASSGSYNDLKDKPTIPPAVTESTVSGWGFTKNKGTVTQVKINGVTKNPNTNGLVDLGYISANIKTLTITQNGSVLGTFDGTSDVTINIPAAQAGTRAGNDYY